MGSPTSDTNLLIQGALQVQRCWREHEAFVRFDDRLRSGNFRCVGEFSDRQSHRAAFVRLLFVGFRHVRLQFIINSTRLSRVSRGGLQRDRGGCMLWNLMHEVETIVFAFRSARQLSLLRNRTDRRSGRVFSRDAVANASMVSFDHRWAGRFVASSRRDLCERLSRAHRDLLDRSERLWSENTAKLTMIDERRTHRLRRMHRLYDL